jgi:hypothetical protein
MTAPAGLRPCVAITGSVLMFALLIEKAGLIPAVTVTVVIASLGSPDVRIRDALMFAVCLAAAMSLLFVSLLDQPFTLLAGF